MNKIPFKWLVLLCLVILTPNLMASGISIDAGLTPAKNRFMMRAQWRTFERSNSQRSMDMNAFVGVLAYGLRRDVTIMVKQAYMLRNMSMPGMTIRDNGFADIGLLMKYKLYRENTATRIFGLASTIEVQAPSGQSPFSAPGWDLKPGLYSSLRLGRWAMDATVSYSWKSIIASANPEYKSGDELNIDWALALQIPMGSSGFASLAPVLENSIIQRFNGDRNGETVQDGELIWFLSPGIKYTISSFIIEGLYRLPVYQTQNGSGLEQGSFAILGMRYMF